MTFTRLQWTQIARTLAAETPLTSQRLAATIALGVGDGAGDFPISLALSRIDRIIVRAVARELELSPVGEAPERPDGPETGGAL